MENNSPLTLTHGYLVMSAFWLSQMVGRVPLASPEWEKAEVQLSQDNGHESLPQSRGSWLQMSVPVLLRNPRPDNPLESQRTRHISQWPLCPIFVLPRPFLSFF